MFSRLLPLFVLIIFFSPASAWANVDFLKLEPVSFYGLYVNGNKIGYVEDKLETVENDEIKTVIYKSKIYFELGEIEGSVSVFDLSLQYNFNLNTGEMQTYYERSKEISYDNRDDFINKNEAEVQVSTLSADYMGSSTYKVTESDGNLVKEKQVSLPILFVYNFFSDVNFIQNYQHDNIKTNVDVADLYFDEERAIQSEIKVLRTHDYIRDNKTFTQFELEIKDDDTTVTSVFDANGNLLRGEIFGIDFKREPEEIAKSLDAERHISILYSYSIDKLIPIDAVTDSVELRIFGDFLRDYFVENERQEILERTDDYILAKFYKGNKLKVPTDQSSISQFLEATKKYNWENKSLNLINPANELEELSVEEKVKVLLDFTYNYIEYEFTLEASLQEIIDQKFGDCTEYAQLFISLARLNGIPAREVSGLAYNYIDENPMYYGHAWAEVWFNGRWKEVDPGWNDFHLDATHIRLTDDYFSDSNFFIAEQIELVRYD